MAIGTKITTAGAVLLAKALGGKELKFTRGACGDAMKNGSMKTPSTKERDALTALIHERMSLPITGYEIVDDQIIVSLRVSNETVTEDFRIAELGLFAEDPDTHLEKLYSYAFEGDDGDKMHAADTNVQLEFQDELVTKIANAANVTAVITRIYNGLTQEDLDAHINSTDPHPNWEVVKAGVGLSKTNNTLNVVTATDKRLGGIKVGKNLYMDDDTLNAVAGETDVENRLRQIEINQANLYILLESLHRLGDQADLILLEDFKTLKDTNTATANATIAAKGKEFNVDSLSFLRPANSCVITDGLLFNKFITADSIKAVDNVYVVTAGSNLTTTTTKGKAYRSSVTFKNDKAYGAGLVKTRTQSANKIWKGESSGESQSAAFNAYASLESSFDLEGDWSLTADGYFTLG